MDIRLILVILGACVLFDLCDCSAYKREPRARKRDSEKTKTEHMSSKISAQQIEESKADISTKRIKSEKSSTESKEATRKTKITKHVSSQQGLQFSEEEMENLLTNVKSAKGDVSTYAGSMGAALTSIEKALKSYRLRIENVSTELETYEKKESTIMKNSTKMQTQKVQKFERHLQQQIQTITTLQTNLTTIETRLHGTETTRTADLRLIKDMETRIIASEKALHNIQLDITSHKSAFRNLTHRVETLGNEVKKAEQTASKLKKRVDKIETDVKENEKNIKTITGHVDDNDNALTLVNQKLQTKRKEMTKLTTRVDKYEERISQLEHRMKYQSVKNDDLLISIDTVNKSVISVNQSLDITNVHVNEIGVNETKCELTAKHTSDHVMTNKNNIHKLEESMEKNKRENSERVVKLEHDLRAALDIVKGEMELIAKLEGNVKAYTKRYDSLEKRVDKFSARLKTMESSFKTLTTTVETLTTTVTGIRTTLNTLSITVTKNTVNIKHLMETPQIPALPPPPPPPQYDDKGCPLGKGYTKPRYVCYKIYRCPIGHGSCTLAANREKCEQDGAELWKAEPHRWSIIKGLWRGPPRYLMIEGKYNATAPGKDGEKYYDAKNHRINVNIDKNDQDQPKANACLVMDRKRGGAMRSRHCQVKKNARKDVGMLCAVNVKTEN